MTLNHRNTVWQLLVVLLLFAATGESWGQAQPAAHDAPANRPSPVVPPLSRELQLIRAASQWPRESTGVDLIRAVNALHKLGKQRALESLEQYLKLSEPKVDPAEHEIVFWIVRLLFEPIRAERQADPPFIAIYLMQPTGHDRGLWPLAPLELSHDVPLMVGDEIGFGGGMESPSSYVLWARRFGVLRDAPLHPTRDPLTAVDLLTRSPKFARLEGDGDQGQIAKFRVKQLRKAALAMVAHLDERLSLDESPVKLTDQEWRRQRALVQHLGVTWDPEAQQFVCRQ